MTDTYNLQFMMLFAIWFAGTTLTLRSLLEIVCLKVPVIKRITAIILVLLTSWIGALFYTFYAKEKMKTWLS